MIELQLEGTVGIKIYNNEEELVNSLSKILNNSEEDEILTFKIKKSKIFVTVGTVREKILTVLKIINKPIQSIDIFNSLKDVKLNAITRELTRMKVLGLISKIKLNKKTHWSLE